MSIKVSQIWPLIFVISGYHGSCWFLSTVGSLVNFKNQHYINRAVQVGSNSTSGPESGKLKFKFQTFDGEREVVIDDRLPRNQAEMADHSNDYWVPLFEKAYAKFVGSYKVGLRIFKFPKV